MKSSEIVLGSIGKGEKNAITSKELQKITGLKDRDLRRFIENLRRLNYVIASNEKGYFVPVTVEEVRRHIKKENRRARSIMYTLKSARALLRQMEEGKDEP